MWTFIGVISFLSLFVFIIMGIVSAIRKKPSIKRNFIIAGASFTILIIAFSVDPADTGSMDTETVLSSPSISESKDVIKAEDMPVASEKLISTPVASATPKPEPTPSFTPEPKIKETTGQSNAVRAARDYLNYTAFSRSGLIEQLEFEGYSSADAEYAVDKIDADWKEQAAIAAKDYLEYSSFSKQGLKEQLEFEGYTSEQAEYGADKVYK